MPRWLRGQSARPCGPVLVEREARFDAWHIRLVNQNRLRHFAFALGGFALEEVSASGLGADNLAASGDFETFGNRLAGFASGNGLWHDWKKIGQNTSRHAHGKDILREILVAGTGGHGHDTAMQLEILNTGSELLLGDVTNTNLPALASRLDPLGLRVARQTAVPDGAPIREAVGEALGRCGILLVTGGLGPTTDDVTREVCAELLGLPLDEDPSIMEAITRRLAKRGVAFKERMRRQAMVPRGAEVLPNNNGTAPGLYIPPVVRAWRATPHLFLLPGPPRELLPMFDASVLPILRRIAGGLPMREKRIYRVVGMGESWVEEAIGLELDKRGDIEVGYCARPNEVDLRLIAAPDVLDAVEPAVLAAVGQHLVSRKGERLEEWIVAELRRRRLTLAAAESCTGGLLAHRVTNIPGASEIFRAGWVTYSNQAKISQLGVPPSLIETNGAVSAPVAAAMAEGARAAADADFALSLTGIAGPDGGSEEKPVGTVFIGLAMRGHPATTAQAIFPSDRETFKQLATQRALDILRLRLLAP